MTNDHADTLNNRSLSSLSPGDQTSEVRVSKGRSPSRGSRGGSFLPLPVFWAPGMPGAHTVSMCPKGFVKFYAGDFSLEDAPHSGRPVEVDRDQIENNQHYTTQETEDILEIPNSNAENHCINLVRLITLMFGPAALHPQASAPRVCLSQERLISSFQGDRQEMEPLTSPLNCAL